MSTNAPESNTTIPPAPSVPADDACAPVTTSDPDTIFIPFLGHIPRPRGHWQPTRPGPQGHNRGITPGFSRHKPRPLEPDADIELLLSEAMCRIAALEAANATGAK